MSVVKCQVVQIEEMNVLIAPTNVIAIILPILQVAGTLLTILEF